MPKAEVLIARPHPLRLTSLTAIVQDDDARADEFCALAGNPAGLNRFDDSEEAKPVINRIGDPTMSPGNVAKMNISMPIRHGVFVTRFRALADEHERLARPKVLTRIAATLDAGGRFASQLGYPARVGPHTLLLEEGQRASPATLWADLLRLAIRSNKKRVDSRKHDRRPSQEGTDETVEVPGRHPASLPAGNHCRGKSENDRHPDWPELQQPLKHCCFVHVATSRFDHAAILAKDERKAGIEINTTPVIEAMSAHHKVGDGLTRHAGATGS